MVVEPAADHSPPVNIGGNDVDFSIADTPPLKTSSKLGILKSSKRA